MDDIRKNSKTKQKTKTFCNLTKIYYPDLTRSRTDTHTQPHAHTLTHIYEFFV